MASVGGGGPCPARANGSAYRRREPESTLPHATVRAHLKTFLAQVEQRSDGTGLPRFVVSEFERYLAEGELRADRGRRPRSRPEFGSSPRCPTSPPRSSCASCRVPSIPRTASSSCLAAPTR